MPPDTVDTDLLAAARTAAGRLADLERDAHTARADYHHAVRRLHLAGAPLRDVAQALGISHQRVQQIVQARGGTWWSRVWHGRKLHADLICSFCDLPPGQVNKLIAGPKVYICDACVLAAEQVLRGEKTTESGSAQMEPVAATSRLKCSFCGKKSRHDRAVVGSRDKRVCDVCLALCRRILDDRSPSSQPPRQTLGDAHP